jgi:branched-chain amino acid transport system ATP-binding protein
MLEVAELHVGYGRAHVLHGLDFTVAAGEVVALLGRNGAGKSSTLKAVLGLLRPRSGRIRLNGVAIESWETYRRVRAGLGYVPEERRLFASLTVAENLLVGRQPPRPGLPPFTEARVFALFPSLASLRHRLAGQLSGGEQQMLTIARSLMGNPRCLLLDEPSQGLAPLVVREVQEALRALKAAGVALLLAEQSTALAVPVADRALVLAGARLAWAGPMAALRQEEGLRQAGLVF